jgi:broad specificity phosphatase PhoE
MSLTVTLVRHGNTDANNERWLQGHVGSNIIKSSIHLFFLANGSFV